jgi:general secretion pathway protein E
LEFKFTPVATRSGRSRSLPALTGHLVLSTLRTNDAPSALTRLLELNVAASLVASTVQAVLAQRLVRVICTSCKTRVPAVAADLAELSGGAVVDHICRGGGCSNCRGTGHRGRVAFMNCSQ